MFAGSAALMVAAFVLAASRQRWDLAARAAGLFAIASVVLLAASFYVSTVVYVSGTDVYGLATGRWANTMLLRAAAPCAAGLVAAFVEWLVADRKKRQQRAVPEPEPA